MNIVQGGVGPLFIGFNNHLREGAVRSKFALYTIIQTLFFSKDHTLYKIDIEYE